jgi:fatty-acyl-CoA synthase
MISPEGLTLSGFVDAGEAEAYDAIIFPETRMTRGAVRRESIRRAKGLRALGVGPGDHVGLMMPAGADLVLNILATARLGAVGVPVNDRFKSFELGFIASDSDMRVFVIAPEFTSLLPDALPSLASGRAGALHLPEAPVLRNVVVFGDSPLAGTAQLPGTTVWADAMTAGARIPDAEIDELSAGIEVDDPLWILYTSGTTSRPRGCVHTHRGFLHQGVALARRLHLTSADRFWTPLPFFHVGGFDVLLASLAAGCPMVHTATFEPGKAVAQLIDERVTVAFPAFETIWLPILNHPAFSKEDVPSLRLVVNVGTPERMRLMEERVPHATQISCTGSTEGAGFVCVGAIEDSPQDRAVWAGVPVTGMEGRIVDPETRLEVPDGTLGEMQFRGVSRFAYYYRDPQLTATRIDADGWYSTGDQLERDALGRFRFVGRLGDFLKVGGENVAPADVENYLATHPAVQMVQVVGAPDTRYAEVAAAFVELVPGAEVTEAELIDFCLGRIATYKVPRYVEFVTEWPMSGTKIQKFKLREQIAARLAAAGITEAPKLYSKPVPSGTR